MPHKQQQIIISMQKEDFINNYASFKSTTSKKLIILRGILGSISIFASSLVMWMILRSHKRLSTTLHRLIFALSISDIIFSACAAFSSVAVPKDVDYMFWNANGNIITCSIFGFTNRMGTFCTQMYTCSLSVYFLQIVKYGRSDDEMKKKFEPWFHGVSLVIALLASILGIYLNTFNPTDYGLCGHVAYNPPHCHGYQNGVIPEGDFVIPCGRGAIFASIRPFTLYGGLFGVIGTITYCMVATYRSVVHQEMKQSSYGVESIRASIRASAVLESTTNHYETSISKSIEKEKIGGFVRVLSFFHDFCKSNLWWNVKSRLSLSCGSSKDSNVSRFQSRAVWFKMLAYSLSWFLTWGVFHDFRVIQKFRHGQDACTNAYVIILYTITRFVQFHHLHLSKSSILQEI